MKSYLGSEKLKKEFIKEIKWHQKQDAIVQGSYGSTTNGVWKGCAVGCSLKSLNKINNVDLGTGMHARYETELGVPRVLAKLEDSIFERLSVEDSKRWPLQFAEAVPVGANLEMVWPKLAVWLLADKKDGVIKFAKTDNQRKVIQDVADLYSRKIKGEVIDINSWLTAKNAAASYAASYAANAYAYAAAAASYAAAAASYAAAAASYAADADAYAASYAASANAYAYAYAASYAAAADAYAAYAASYAAAADAADARRTFYKKCARKLLSLLKSSK